MVMNLRFSTIAQAFFWSIFAGVTGIGIGLGAAFPPLNYVAAPFVCPGGTMTNTTQGYTVSPVESVTTVSLYCVEATTGSRREVGMFPTVLYSGVMYGLVIFAVVVVIMVTTANNRQARPPAEFVEAPGLNRGRSGGMRQQNRTGVRAGSTGDPEARLEKLRDMLSSGLITQQEYDQKKREILEEM